MWWGRWDLNPGSHAPQACILVQTSRQTPEILAFQAHSKLNLKLDDDPALNEYSNNILKTIEQMKANGLSENIRKKTQNTLQRFNKHVDLMNPEAVKLYIADLKVKKTAKDIEKSTKQKYINQYDYFVQFNNLSWEKPIYRFDTKVPITPTKIQATQIISAAPTQHGATIFNILLEAGFEGQELRNTTRKDIDTEQGIITVAGTKGHRGRAYKFSHNTTEMLRTYLNKTTENEPFPRPQIMADSWRTARTAAAHKTGNTELLKIPLKGLRNLSGIIVYERTLDPWRVMLHMGHKKLDTTNTT